MLAFEFDPQKSRRNAEKHGIDVLGAQALWDDENLLEIPARTEDEERYLVIGMMDGKHWSAVITYRDGSIRIIAVRISRQEEIVLYES